MAEVVMNNIVPKNLLTVLVYRIYIMDRRSSCFYSKKINLSSRTVIGDIGGEIP